MKRRHLKMRQYASMTQTGQGTHLRTGTSETMHAEGLVCPRTTISGILVLAMFLCIFAPGTGFAQESWVGASGAWNTRTNWSPQTVPTSGSSVIFGSAGTADVTFSGASNASSITFVAGAKAFTIGNTISTNTLTLSNGGTVQIANTVTNGETIAERIALGGASYTFANNDTTTTGTLDFTGRITGDSAAASTLTLTGVAGSGTNIISGSMRNGTGAGGVARVLSLSVAGGNWSLMSTGNTYTGATTVAGGQLILGASGALGSGSSAISLKGGTMLLNASSAISGTTNNVTMNGGTLALKSSAASFSESLGTLTLSSNSTIDFANATGSTIRFSALAGTPSGTLTVDNWSTSDTFAFSGTGNGLATFAANNVRFDIAGIGDVGGNVVNLGGGEYAIMAAIPEPRTVVAGVALLAFIFWKERRRIVGLASLLKRPLAS